MWLLAVYLPLLIGDLIPVDCEQWKLFTLLLKITSITASWSINRATIAYLSILIEEHHFTFKKLYPDDTIIPKMHYMLHYSRQIKSFGPLICSWTMRHEAKLNFIKRAASHGNYKNICYSVMKRYLQALCYDLNCNIPLLSETLESSSSHTDVSTDNEPKELRDYVDQLNGEFEVFRPKWIKSRHLLLKKYAYLYLNNGDYYPNFGKIIDLYLLKCTNRKHYALCIQIYDTLYFDNHFNGFVVEPISPSKYIVINVKSLMSFSVLHAHKSFNDTPENYIVLKQYLL